MFVHTGGVRIAQRSCCEPVAVSTAGEKTGKTFTGSAAMSAHA